MLLIVLLTIPTACIFYVPHLVSFSYCFPKHTNQNTLAFTVEKGRKISLNKCIAFTWPYLPKRSTKHVQVHQTELVRIHSEDERAIGTWWSTCI